MKRLTAILSALLFSLTLLAQNEFTTTDTDKTEVTVQYLSLDECKRLAIENNAKIKNAELDIEAAELTKKGVNRFERSSSELAIPGSYIFKILFLHIFRAIIILISFQK